MPQAPLAIFLSPHFDDIALSCGGIAARLSRMGARCIGVTIFTAPAPEGVPLSPFAQNMHDDWENASGSSIASVNDIRRDEERAALRLLNLEPLWLDLPDAPYRRGKDGQFLYTSNSELMGTVASEEKRELVPWIARQVTRIVSESGVRGRVRLFAPLGVGHHVDHQLAFWAARRLGPRFGVLFYEDYPYVTRPGALQARLDELRTPVQPRITPIADLIGVKIAAIARYKSQLGGLFESSEAMPTAVRTYSQSIAESAGIPGVDYAERAWFIPSGYRLG